MIWKGFIVLAMTWLLFTAIPAQENKPAAVTEGYARIEVRATLIVDKDRERMTVQIVRGKVDLVWPGGMSQTRPRRPWQLVQLLHEVNPAVDVFINLL